MSSPKIFHVTKMTRCSHLVCYKKEGKVITTGCSFIRWVLPLLLKLVQGCMKHQILAKQARYKRLPRHSGKSMTDNEHGGAFPTTCF